MPDIALIVLVLLPLVGAGALLFLGEGNRYRPRDPLPALIAGTVFATALLLQERGPTQIELLPWWDIGLFGSQPAIWIDQFASPFVFGLALLGIAATTVGARLSSRNWATALLLWGGALYMVISANPLTLLLSWIVCELGLVGASLLTWNSRSLVYRLAAGGVGAVALLLLTKETAGAPPADVQTMLAGLSLRWLVAFFAVGALRMGLYPLHLAGFGRTDAALAPLVLGRLASALAGLYLWFRGLEAIHGSPLHIDYLIVWGGVAVLVSALATWGARSARAIFPWLVGFELSVIVVALGFAGPHFSMLASLEMVNLLLAGGVLGLSLHTIHGVEGRWTRRWIRGLSLLSLASLLGLPPTPGFAARWGLYRSVIEAGSWAAILPVAVATGLLVPPLLTMIRTEGQWPPRWQPNHAVVGVTVLGLPLALASAQPLLLTPVLDLLTGAKSYSAMIHLVRAASPQMSLKIMTLIIVPTLAGYSLDRVYDRWHKDAQLDELWSVLSLDWLYALLASTVLRAAIAVSLLLAFLELGSTLGWALIAGLLVVLMMLRR
ncbi:MAG: hypothetical protein MAG451_01234 [Anaerolineales bacterium]|nr:hypothetical protein [Anaerolineales bacterium]